MPSEIAQELAESQVTVHQGDDGLPYVDMFGVAQCAYTEARANDWREGLVKELAELTDNGIKTNERDTVDFLEQARNNYGKQDDFWAGMNFMIGLLKESDGL